MQDKYLNLEPDPVTKEIIKEADRKTSSRNLHKPYLHPMYGALKRIIHVRMADGSTKPMKVKTALQKGYIKSS